VSLWLGREQGGRGSRTSAPLAIAIDAHKNSPTGEFHGSRSISAWTLPVPRVTLELLAIGETKEAPMAVSRIAGKMVRWFGYVVLGTIGLGCVAALWGVLVALIGGYVIL